MATKSRKGRKAGTKKVDGQTAEPTPDRSTSAAGPAVAGPPTGPPTGESKALSTSPAKKTMPTLADDSRQKEVLVTLALAGDPGQRLAIYRGEHGDPHLFLGPHGSKVAGVSGTVVRAYQPSAVSAEVLLEQEGADPDQEPEAISMESVDLHLFAAWLPGREKGLSYRLRFTFEDGQTWERGDPYRFAPIPSDEDLYFVSEGTHRRLWECLGAQPHEVAGEAGYGFLVWAPNARRVSVMGEFCAWDSRTYPMRRLSPSGLWELFVPGVESGQLYKFEILGPSGPEVKADPMAHWAELSPGTASRTYRSDYGWQDGEWMATVQSRDVRREPMAIYEVHLGSWRKGVEEPNYRDLAVELVDHVRSLGFNYLELMPVAEHPFTGSWGYQITGYFAPTSRYGTPDDFRFFVDYCHQNGIGVILDWVPAHFVKDAHGLGRFDGTALYEHEDPRRGEHPDWGTYIFNYGRLEVKNFLVANALYWLDEFHIDGLRVDAVASMLYLDYSREEGQWLPNQQGGRENFDAIALFREVNHLVGELYPGRFTVAEESTAWAGITKEPELGGLGFNLKWNMGWMHDTLGYFGTDPLFRSHQHDQLTFAMVYEYSEAFTNPLSHDEVVHGKGSLINKIPGDPWRQFADLRVLLTYQFTRPGKVLLFMGSELAQRREWNHETGLDWFLRDEPQHAAFERFVATLGHFYVETPSLWRQDPSPRGFEWIACHDRERSVFAYIRHDSSGVEGEQKAQKSLSSGAAEPPAKGNRSETAKISAKGAAQSRKLGDHAVVILNLTPVPREGYRIGAPSAQIYRIALNSDDAELGGSGSALAGSIRPEAVACDGLEHSFLLDLPPSSALVLVPVD